MGDDEDGIYIANGSAAFYTEAWIDREPPQVKSLLKWENPSEVPLRIGICGAHGTGKSTLAKALASELNIPLIHSISRTAKEVGFTINKKSDPVAQAAIWLAQLYEQLDVPEFVTDRTLIDHISYLDWLVKHKEFGHNAYFFNLLANITASIYHEQYSIVFYLPISWDLVGNGVRSTDKKYQIEIDKTILRLLNSFYVDYFPLPGCSEDKLELAMSYLEDSGVLEDTDPPSE